MLNVNELDYVMRQIHEKDLDFFFTYYSALQLAEPSMGLGILSVSEAERMIDIILASIVDDEEKIPSMKKKADEFFALISSKGGEA